ncbi:MAG: hypothetical protein EA415_02370 [Sphaerobacteraceae bacterium]|nr:MAG: hypothetical protein EA415_02370 [Sphaerobacteraceae bacterium]
MQAQVQLSTPTRQKLIAAAVVAFLAAMAMVPAARATSLIPEGEVATGEASARSGASNPELSRDQMQFLEDNWYFNVSDVEVSDNPAAAQPDTDGQADEYRPQSVEEFEAMERAPGLYTVSPEAGDNPYVVMPYGGDNPAAVEPGTDDQADEHRPQGVEEFEVMERAPDLYTEAPYAGSPATDDSIDAGLSHDEMKFLHDNWHLAPGIFIIEEEDGGTAPGNPSLSQEQIQFLEDNWYMDAGALMQDDELTDDESEGRAQTREGIQFNEDNWNFDSGESLSEDDAGAAAGNPSLTREEIRFNEDNWNFNLGEAISEEDVDETGPEPSSGNNTDRADALAELQSDDDEADDDRSHDELTYPWGGFLEHDY